MKIKMHLMFDINHDRIYKVMRIADRYLIDVLIDSVFADVVF